MVKNYYVVAVYHDGLSRYRRYLCGPFETQRAARLMIKPVRQACLRLYSDQPRYRMADYLAINAGNRSTPGKLDLKLAVDENWLKYVLTTV